MEKRFNINGFMAYLQYTFPSVFTGNRSSFTRDMVENLIIYACENKLVSKDQFCYFVSDMLPEVEFGEVAAFMDDECLTESYGLPEKCRVMQERDIQVYVDEGITYVIVKGEELPI